MLGGGQRSSPPKEAKGGGSGKGKGSGSSHGGGRHSGKGSGGVCEADRPKYDGGLGSCDLAQSRLSKASGGSDVRDLARLEGNGGSGTTMVYSKSPAKRADGGRTSGLVQAEVSRGENAQEGSNFADQSMFAATANAPGNVHSLLAKFGSSSPSKVMDMEAANSMLHGGTGGGEAKVWSNATFVDDVRMIEENGSRVMEMQGAMNWAEAGL